MGLVGILEREMLHFKISRMDELKNFLEGLLNSEFEDFYPLSGGASAEIYNIVLKNGKKLVLRRTPEKSESRLAIPKKIEAKVQKIVKKNEIPVPEIIEEFDESSGVGSGYIMEFVLGETIPRKILRDERFAQIRPNLALRIGEVLAKIHQTDLSEIKELEKMTFYNSLNKLYEVYSSFNEPQPVFEYVFNYLAKVNIKEKNNVLIHGDYRLGNFIVSENSIESIIDWELTHIGDPLEDLSWVCVKSWRFGNNSKRVAGLGDLEDLIKGYESISSETVDRFELDVWQIYGSLRWGVICMIQTFAHLNSNLNSIEKAAIGRRVSETEYDLMNMIKNKEF
jgi:aminoglycoside phosphotransferase (APT) family kinase protein